MNHSRHWQVSKIWPLLSDDLCHLPAHPRPIAFRTHQIIANFRTESSWDGWGHLQPQFPSPSCDANITRKPSGRWQTRATLAKSLHGLLKSSGVVTCIARLPIDSLPMVSYYVLTVCKMRRFGDTRLLKLPWPWNSGQGSHKVIESDTIR